eukprot:TRINITY_DN3435_c0_g1_i1.p1 TRINITY_DN3435_c0_g1~~TRINITY_DN3435_c0_g1_i1.p1  ORF type:complete len:563 (-),score=140.14 TRINITY_DN3435_c0_g1_i1:5-1693(-)
MKAFLGFFALFFVLLLSFAHSAFIYTGVNLAGAEFGSAIPGTYGTDYLYPTSAEVDYFMGKGMNVFRLPFRWERLTPTLGQASLDPTEVGRIDTFVNYATGKGAFVVLDPHNYAKYKSDVIGGTIATTAKFAAFWAQLANRYKTNSKVIFGLMNEPDNQITTETWGAAANASIIAIRNTGATNLILVPGVVWTGGHSWLQTWYGTPNGNVMKTVKDPGNNMAFEIHQYLDSDYSGTNAACKSTTVGSETLAAVTNWAKTNNFKLFLGEFGAGSNDQCKSAVTNLMTYLSTNSDAWIGFTWWAGGPMWGDYMFTLEPKNGADSYHMAQLLPYLVGASGTTTGATTTTGSRTTTTTGSQSTTTTGNPTTGTSGSSVFVYQDKLMSGWEDWSWSTSYSLSNTAVVRGTKSISFTPTAFEGVYLHCGNCFGTSQSGIRFWVNGGPTGNQAIRLGVRRDGAETGSFKVLTGITANSWKQYYVTFQQLSVTSGSLDGIVFQDDKGSAQSILYIDDVEIVTEGSTTTASNGATTTTGSNGVTTTNTSEDTTDGDGSFAVVLKNWMCVFS